MQGIFVLVVIMCMTMLQSAQVESYPVDDLQLSNSHGQMASGSLNDRRLTASAGDADLSGSELFLKGGLFGGYPSYYGGSYGYGHGGGYPYYGSYYRPYGYGGYYGGYRRRHRIPWAFYG
jgi:hypothetical protein